MDTTFLGVGGFWINLASLLIALLSAGFGIWTYLKSKKRKLVTYEFEDNNTNVVSVNRDKGEDIKILLDNQPVQEVRYQLIKIRNEGNVDVDTDKDYKNPLHITFVPIKPSSVSSPSQVILRAGIPEASQPFDILDPTPKDHIILDTTGTDQYVALKNVLLNAGDWIKIKVLTREKVEIRVDGQLREGKIRAFVPPQNFLTWRKVINYAVLSALLLFVLYNSIGLVTAFFQGNCVTGSVEVKGSSAFYTAAAGYAVHYREACPVGLVRVDQDTSGSGILDLKNGTIQGANSEIPGSLAGLNPANFEDHQVAVIVFTVVVSKDVTGIVSLTRDQLTKIYNGTYRNWKDVDSRAPNLPIRVFGRPTTSGTYVTFTHYVLGKEVRNAPSYQDVDRTDLMAQTVAQAHGAIGYVDEGTAGQMSSMLSSVEINQAAPTHGLVESNTYPFWAIEHMYTKKNPDKLATSFITYVTSSVETNDTFIKPQDMPEDILQTRI